MDSKPVITFFNLFPAAFLHNYTKADCWMQGCRQQCFGLQNVHLNYAEGMYVFVAVKSWLNNILKGNKSMDFYSSKYSCVKSHFSVCVRGGGGRRRNSFLVPSNSIFSQHLCNMLCPAFFPTPNPPPPPPQKITWFSSFCSFRIEGLGLFNPVCTSSLVFLPACIPVRQIPPNKPFYEALSVTASLRKKKKMKTFLPIIRANKQTKPLKAALRLNSWSYFM